MSEQTYQLIWLGVMFALLWGASADQIPQKRYGLCGFLAAAGVVCLVLFTQNLPA